MGQSFMTLQQMRDRLQDVEHELQQIAKRLADAPLEEQAGLFAHQASLLSKKHWFLTRIRAQVPIEPLDVEVHERIKTGDGLG